MSEDRKRERGEEEQHRAAAAENPGHVIYGGPYS